MNAVDIAEVNEKSRRVRNYFAQSGYEAMVIGRTDNFAWFTCGGNNKVLNTTEYGFTILVITESQVYVVSQVMDGPRIAAEELYGLDYEPVFLRWYEESREEKVTQLIKGLKTISDLPLISGADYAPAEIYKLHYPLTEKEIDKCRWIGDKSEAIIRKVADETRPGLTEYEIEAMLHYEFTKLDMTLDASMVGSDDRIIKYRHPISSPKKVEKIFFIHPAVRKWGLHANITRMVYFGDRLPTDIAQRYQAVCQVEAAAIARCVPGERFSRILEIEKQIYRDCGFAEEWRNHFQGGITGYLLADPSLCKDPKAEVSLNQAYDWFITITGVKVEELSINTANGREIISATGKWPTQQYVLDGQSFQLPQILLK